MEPQELPLGLGMALAQHPDAMARFTAMSEAEQYAILQAAHNVHSKKEMQNLVSQLSRQS